MLPADALAAAVDLAEHQLLLLQEGKIDEFLSGLEAHGRACEALALIPGLLGDQEARLAVDRLIATNEAAARTLDDLLSATATRMRFISRARRASGAYLQATPAPGPLRSQG